MRLTLYRLLYNFRNAKPVRLVTVGYLAYILVGWLLLCLPFSVSGPAAVPALDHLFIATSAVSTTGLATVNVSGQYTFFGQAVILVLIQLGGIGYMTFGSFVVLSTRRAIDSNRQNLMRTVFSIPKDFRIEKFILSVVAFTAVIEILGAAALLPIFIQSGAPNPVWQAVFHSVSSFCTAGFGLFPDSFEGYRHHLALNLVVAALSLLGAVGFIVCVDVWRVVRGKSERVTLTTRIILLATGWLLLAGMAAVFLTEPSTQGAGPAGRMLTAFFQAMSALTTVGFNTVPIGSLGAPAIAALIFLMVIGASPSGTGGGLKTTTFSAAIGFVRSVIRGEREVRFFGARVPDERIQTALATLCLYLATLGGGVFLLLLTEKAQFLPLLFESASALGTVGLSMGITGSLTELGKLTVILMMFVGRVGPLTLGAALFVKPELIFDDEKTDLAV